MVYLIVSTNNGIFGTLEIVLSLILHLMRFFVVDTPLSESRFADMLEGWVDEEREVHDEHDLHAAPDLDDHDDHDDEDGHDGHDDNDQNSQENEGTDATCHCFGSFF